MVVDVRSRSLLPDGLVAVAIDILPRGAAGGDRPDLDDPKEWDIDPFFHVSSCN